MPCTDSFNKWDADYLSKRIYPKNEREARFWEDNSKRLPINIGCGFIDPHKIPNREESTNSGIALLISVHEI